jgi:UDP-glucose:(heptosyl)LPS alpha-1,3-glucosyltransferase
VELVVRPVEDRVRTERVPSPARRLTIALGVYRLLPLGGLEDNCIRIAAELQRRGHDVTLYVAGAHPEVPVKIVSLAPSHDPWANHARVARFAADFGAATRGRYDRTVGFQPLSGLDVLFSADWLRNQPFTPLWRRLTPRFRAYAALEQACFSNNSTTRIIGLSGPQIRAYLARYGTTADRIAIVPPTLSPDKRKPQLRTPERRAAFRADLGLDGAAKVWLWLGLQPSVKGLDRVIEALVDHPQAHLVVGGIGRGERKGSDFRQLAEKRGVARRIHWQGFLSGDRLVTAIAGADALAHPARVDVTGGVILEAIVNGLPVVATGVCGFAPHVLRSGAGRIVPEPFDAAAFSAALGEVCGPANAACSAKGIAYGHSPSLYSGTGITCDLIEAEQWPVTEAMSRGSRPVPGPRDILRAIPEPPQGNVVPLRPR